jgi:hypothetical protein
MDTFNVVAGLASIISLVFALVVYHRSKTAEAREEGNVKVFRERLRNIDSTMRATMTIMQILIRRADDTDAPVVELQNIGRSARASLYGAMEQAWEIDKALGEWKFGHLLETSRIAATPESGEQGKGVVDKDAVEHGEKGEISPQG